VIGIIGAMDVEIEQLLLHMLHTTRQEIDGQTYIAGELERMPVVVTKSGVGKVNATIAAMTLIRQYSVKAILFIGVAGALHPDLEIGDMIISNCCQEHDIDASILGFSRGTVPFQAVSEYPADDKLVQQALAAAVELQRSEQITIRAGKVLSGDQFISDKEVVSYLHNELGGDCVEMEGAAVAHTCYVTNTPYVVIRSMSDRADHQAPVDFDTFTELAAVRACRLVKFMLHQMALAGTE
jgi:adenosylhomocysteine nucleosidase